MNEIIVALNGISDWSWYSSSPTGNYICIVIYSLISAFIFLLIFKKISNQSKIKQHKKKIVGYILQIRLYQDRFSVIFLSILHILKHNLLYIRYTLSSFVVIIIPLLIISIQINNRAGYEPMSPGQKFIITSQLDAANFSKNVFDALEEIACSTSSGIIIETLPLRIPTENKILWRGRITSKAEDGKEYIKIVFKDNRKVVVKEIATEISGKSLSPRIEKLTLGSAFLSNAEGFLPAKSPISSISINYQRAVYPFLFWKVDALILYFILTLLFAFALKSLIKVSI